MIDFHPSAAGRITELYFFFFLLLPGNNTQMSKQHRPRLQTSQSSQVGEIWENSNRPSRVTCQPTHDLKNHAGSGRHTQSPTHLSISQNSLSPERYSVTIMPRPLQSPWTQCHLTAACRCPVHLGKVPPFYPHP